MVSCIAIVNYFILGIYNVHGYLTDEFEIYHITPGRWAVERFIISTVILIFFVLKYRMQTNPKWSSWLNFLGLLLLLFCLRVTNVFIDILNFMQEDTYPYKEGLGLVTYFMEYFGLLLIYILLAYQIVVTIITFINGKSNETPITK
jgi:drug/metabolite transporter (DMT)-like permease